ncbi:MAG: hypothetical protein RIC87_08010 [Kiloniellales bacterium]
MRCLFAAALVAAFLIPGSAQAVQCGPKEGLERFLKERHGETLAFTGIASNGGQLRLYLNPESGSWTVALRPPQSPQSLCPLSEGHGGAVQIEYLPES